MDAIMKLYKTFGNTAKAQDRANLQHTQAQTGATNAQAGYTNAEAGAVPTRTANDTTRAKASETSANASATNAVTEAGKLPILTMHEENVKEGGEADRELQNKKMLAQQGEFQQTLAQQINQLAEQQSYHKDMLGVEQQKALNEEKYQGAVVGLNRERNDRESQQKDLELADKLWQQLGMTGDAGKSEIADKVLYHYLRKSMPDDVARTMLEQIKTKNDSRSKYQQPAPSQRKNPYSAAPGIPGLPSLNTP